MQMMEERNLALAAISKIVGMAVEPCCICAEWLEATITRLDREQSLKAGRLAPSSAASFLNEHNKQMQLLRQKAEVVIRCNSIYHPRSTKAPLNMSQMLAMEKSESETNELVDRLESVRDSFGIALKSKVQRDLEQKRNIQ